METGSKYLKYLSFFFLSTLYNIFGKFLIASFCSYFSLLSKNLSYIGNNSFSVISLPKIFAIS